jgi:nucleoside-diphosphate-sugar epimerase
MSGPIAFVTGGSGFIGGELIRLLHAEGWQVRALGRSPAALARVEALGAEPVPGDIAAAGAGIPRLNGVEAVFHSAAWLAGGDPAQAQATNVGGTAAMLAAARAAGVPRFVHVGTEAVLVGGPPIRNADETWPLPDRPIGHYPATKAEAEKRVRAANAPGFATVVVRPRFVWGKGDRTLLPRLAASVKSGQFAWIAGGRYRTSTTHVRNVCEGLLKAAQSGRPGGVYFVTDGAPIEFRAMVEALLATQGIAAPTLSVPHALAALIAAGGEALGRVLGRKTEPMLSRTVVRLIGEEVTVNDALARREIGYVGAVTREEGLAELAQLAGIHPDVRRLD